MFSFDRVMMSIIRYFPYVYFIIFPFRKHLRFGLLPTIAAEAALTFIGTFITLYGAYYHKFIWSSLIVAILTILFFMLFLKLSFLQIVFIYFIVKNYVDIVTLFAGIIAFDTFSSIIVMHLNRLVLFHILLALLTTFPMWLLMSKMLRPFIENSRDYTFWIYLWVIPAANFFIFRIGVYPLLTTVPYTNYERFYLLCCAWTIGSILYSFVALKMLSETIENNKLKNQISMFQIQLQAQREQYAMYQKNFNKMKRLRHDLRHHLYMIKELLNNRQSQGIDQYVTDYINNLELEEEAVVCENYAVNALASHYLKLAEHNAINLHIRLDIPHNLKLSDSDLCVIFGNLLENAFEACLCQQSGPRFIDCKAMSEHGIFTIVIKNSFDTPSIQFQNGLFLSTKHDGIGIGIESVRTIIQQYGGVAKFTFDNNIFTASLMLPF